MRSRIDRALLFSRTLRHLRWEQWFYRPVRRIQQRLPVRLTPKVHSPPAERFQALSEEVRAWHSALESERLDRAEAVVAGSFRFLNHSEELPEIDWRKRYVSHLWSYNLHYFDYALDLACAFRGTGDERYRDRFVELADSWIEGNPVGKGDGWEPYALSLRTVNWVYAVLLIGESLDQGARQRIERSIALQIEYLSTRLELHILANHLQKNLKSLVIAGVYFGGPSADQWRRVGSKMLWRELFEQILPDGGHYERSPMYHAITLADFLEVIALERAVGDAVPDRTGQRVRQMVRAMGVLSDQSGRLHLFNDAASGIAPTREWISNLANRAVGEPIPELEGELALPDTGYYGYADSAAGERLLVDCGPLGPDYQPGHGHCDLLSFEWIVDGRPVVVDSGVKGYEGDSLREYVRSTRAHNTISVRGGEQAEMWGTFRVARRPRVLEAAQKIVDGNYHFYGSYRPYFDERVAHRRTLTRGDEGLAIHDRIDGADGVVTSYLHLHPDFEVQQDEGVFLASADDFRIEIVPWGADRISLVKGDLQPAQGWYCPEFGVGVPAPVLVMESAAGSVHEMGYRLQVLEPVGDHVMQLREQAE